MTGIGIHLGPGLIYCNHNDVKFDQIFEKKKVSYFSDNFWYHIANCDENVKR